MGRRHRAPRRQAPPAEDPARQDKQLEVEQSDLRIDVIAEDDGVMILAEIPVSDSDGVRVSRRERKVRLATGGGLKAEAELPCEVSGKPTRRRLRNGALEVRYANGS